MPTRRQVRNCDVPGYPAAQFKAFDLDGGRPGPVLSIAAGMGGTAYAGIEACWRLIGNLEQSTFNGRVTIIPTIDTTGFMHRQAHFCRLDDRAVAYAFQVVTGHQPAQSESPSNAIASAVLDALGMPDFHVDLRGGEVHEQHAHWIAVFADDLSKGASAARAAEMSNATFRVRGDGSQAPTVVAGSAGAMASMGVPSLAITTGGIGFEMEADAKILEYSVTCVLKELGVLEWDSADRPAPPRIVGPRTWTHTAATQGLWTASVAPGARVLRGEMLGQVSDYFGSVLETVNAPFDGWVLRVLTTLAVDATPRADGDTWFMETMTLAEDSSAAKNGSA